MDEIQIDKAIIIPDLTVSVVRKTIKNKDAVRILASKKAES